MEISEREGKMTRKMYFGPNVKHLRETHNLSQEDLEAIIKLENVAKVLPAKAKTP